MRHSLLLCLVLLLSGALVGCDSADDDEDGGGSISVGSSVTGSLTTDDPVCNNERRCDRYTLNVDDERTVTIAMSSEDFDTYLYLYRGGDVVEADDDGGDGFLNSEISRTLPSGQYEIRASHFDVDSDYGEYVLEID